MTDSFPPQSTSILIFRLPLGILDELAVAVSALVVLLTAPGGTILRDVGRPTGWTGYLDSHGAFSPKIYECDSIILFFLYPLR
jgi:hypothetical protein